MLAVTSFAVIGLLGDDDEPGPPRTGDSRVDAATRARLGRPRTPSEIGPNASESDIGASSVATATTTPSAGTVRLAGRLVANQLEAAWVLAPRVKDRPRADPAAIGRDGGGWQRPGGATPVEADGAFALDLPPGRHVVLAGARGCTTRVEAIDVVAGRDDLVWTLAWTAPATLEIELLTATRDPFACAWASVALRASGLEPLIAAVGTGPWSPLVPVDELLDDTTANDTTGLDLDDAGVGRLTLPAGTHEVWFQSLCWVRSGPVFGDLSHGAQSATVTLVSGQTKRVTLVGAAPEGTPCKVVARVRDMMGRPVEGAFVAAWRQRPSSAPHKQLGHGRAAKTGPDGVATLINQQPGGLWLVARGGGRSGSTGPIVLDTPGARVSADVVLDLLEPRGDLVVRVVAAESGEPVESPRLSGLWSSLAGLETVAPGVLRLHDVELGEFVGRVRAPGRAGQVLTLTIEAGRVHEVSTSLALEGVVTGRVVSAHGRDGATVQCRRPGDLELAHGFLAEGHVKRDGTFLVEGLPRGVELALGLRLRGWFTPEVTCVAPADDVELGLPSDPLVSEVLVLGSTDEPVNDASVTIAQPGWYQVFERTNALGLVTIRGTPPPNALVTVNSNTTVPLVAGGRTVVSVHSSRQDEWEGWNEADAEASVSGVVVDETNAPIPFASASLLGDRDDASPCGPDGAFSLLAPVGKAQLWAWRADRPFAVLDVVVPERGLSGVVLRLPVGVRLRVRAPATIFGVSGWSRPGADTSQWIRGTDGLFDLGLVAPGRWELVGHGEDLQPLGSPIVVDVQGPGPFVIELR